ncbi:hypothetical protein IAR55_007180 [Kwoniella newhampshirensis]|uniref:TauD/TfdA-like domain-containing protein n=1 Tax=Kwoniella newhampshirensis TaxID=1651941 RepID=A0AAW0YTE2_9TREE
MVTRTPLHGGRGDIGCVLEGLDCNNLSDDEFQLVHDAVYRYKVVVIRGQSDLTPANQLALNKRFDPEATSYGHANNSQRRQGSILSKDGITIPSVPQVQVLGEGSLDTTAREWYRGLEGSVARHPTHQLFHRNHLSDADLAKGKTRFYRWHIDAALYDIGPPLVTTLLGVKNPKGPSQTVVYDDGSGDELVVPLGGTAFVSGAEALRALPEDLRELALHSSVTYAPHPYSFISEAKAHSTGLVCLSEGLEKPLTDLPPYEESKLLTLPLVWTNPVTGEKSLQVHGACVWRLNLKRSTDDNPIVVNDIAQVRTIIYSLMRPGISPSRVYAHAWQDGDLVVFDNRSVWHSVMGQNFGHRLMHQCNLASSKPIR